MMEFKPGDKVRRNNTYARLWAPLGFEAYVVSKPGKAGLWYHDKHGTLAMLVPSQWDMVRPEEAIQPFTPEHHEAALAADRARRTPCDHELALAESLEIIRLAACPHLPADPKARKAIPLATGLLDYFPDALAAVAALSFKATEQHHPGEPCHWDRNKSPDEADTLFRHFLDRGTVDTDGQRHSTKVAWRALALLQKELEAAKG